MNKEEVMTRLQESVMKYVVNYDKKEEDNYIIRQCDLTHFLSSYYVYLRFTTGLTEWDLDNINNANYAILLQIDSNSAETVELKQNIDRTLSLVV